MRILMAHNFYQQGGGEDVSFQSEADVLVANGHEVLRYEVHNDALDAMARPAAALATTWNQRSYRELRALCREFRPAVAHFQNTFPLISPAAYHAVHREGVPVVQSVRNYRLGCLDATYFRDGRPCEDCSDRRVPWPGVAHACYRRSVSASSAVGVMITAHRALGTWQQRVNLYVFLTQFTRDKLRRWTGSTPSIVKPNFVFPDPGIGSGDGRYAIFVGRLSEEKGISTLLRAWRGLGSELPLRIVGDGPLSPVVGEASRETPGIEWLGRRSLQETYDLIGGATCLVLPSIWYETFGRVAVEAFAKGTPVVASDIGAIAEVAAVPRAGVLFRTGDPDDLQRAVRDVLEDGSLAERRLVARRTYEELYSSERNLQQLLDAYTRAGAT